MSPSDQVISAVPAIPDRPNTGWVRVGQSLAGQVPSEALKGPAAPSALSLLQALSRRWVLALGIGLLSAIVVGGATYALVPPAKYTARALLQVSSHPPKIIFDTAEVPTDYRTFQRTQVALIKSRHVLNAALRDPKVAALPSVRQQQDQVEWLEEEVKVEFPGNSEVLQITMSGDHPGDLAVLVNSITEAYLKTVVEVDQNDRRDRLEKLRKLWNKYQDDLKSKRQSLKSLAEAAGSDDRQTLALKQQFTLENLALAEREWMQLQGEIRKGEVLLKVASTEKGEPKPEAALAAAKPAPAPISPQRTEENQALRAAQARVDQLAERLNRARITLRRENDPSVVVMRRELDLAQKSLGRLRARVQETTSDQGQVARVSTKSQIQERIAVLREQSIAVKKDIDRLQQEARSLNLTTLDLHTEQDEIGLVDLTAKKVGTEVEAMSVELLAPARIRVLDKAEIPRRKDLYKQAKLGGMAAVAALLCSLAGVSYWEYHGRRISSAEEVVQSLGIRLVGTLPTFPERNPQPAAATSTSGRAHWPSRLIESVDATRTMLLHASKADGLRVVMVTSAMPGEGKTTLSSHLAASLARAGRKTLLVECDLRSPMARRPSEVSPGPGLCELLRGQATLDEVIWPMPGNKLHVISAGNCDPEALEMLAQDGARTIFEALRDRYDFLIVDSAPILPVVDSLLLSQQVDAVLFSILRGESRVPQVRQAYQQLADLNVRILGAVVNGADCRHYGSYYPATSPSAATVG